MPRWPSGGLTPRAAAELQERLAARVIRTPTFERIETVAGVDVALRGERARAAVVLCAFPGMEVLESAVAERRIEFPYVPGLLGFREVPTCLAAFERLRARPDLLLVDGHGLAHPRRFGTACHLAVELDLPGIGCGKSLLVGEHRDPGPRRGSRARLRHRGETIGLALRTRAGVKPLYVSIGHRIDLATAAKIALCCARRFRLPEPIRAADHLAGTRG